MSNNEIQTSLKVIAHIHTDFTQKFGIPRQSNVVKELMGQIIFEPEYRNPDAIRGQEQRLIEEHGGAQSGGGTSGNKINGISTKNKNKERYEVQSFCIIRCSCHVGKHFDPSTGL